MLNVGRCEDWGGQSIFEEDECLVSALVVTNNQVQGFRWDQPKGGYKNVTTQRPAGCTLRDGITWNEAYFFPYANGECGVDQFNCICRRLWTAGIVPIYRDDCATFGCSEIAVRKDCQEIGQRNPNWAQHGFAGVFNSKLRPSGCFLENNTVYWNDVGGLWTPTLERSKLCICDTRSRASLKQVTGANDDRYCVSEVGGLSVFYTFLFAILTCICFLALRTRGRRNRMRQLLLYNAMFSLTEARPKRSATGDILRISWTELKFEEAIGCGSFGIVRKALWTPSDTKNSQQIVAVKMLQSNPTTEQREQLEVELRLASKMTLHPNVISLFGRTESPISGQLGIIMPYFELGSLKSHLYGLRWRRENNIKFDIVDKLELALNLAAGLMHLHVHMIQHRDIATRNLLLYQCCHKQPQLVISDFGLSRLKADKSDIVNGKMALKWSAPEVIRGNPFTYAADVFSFAITISEIVNEEEPFWDSSPQEAAKRILKGERPELKISREIHTKRKLTGLSTLRAVRFSTLWGVHLKANVPLQQALQLYSECYSSNLTIPRSSVAEKRASERPYTIQAVEKRCSSQIEKKWDASISLQTTKPSISQLCSPKRSIKESNGRIFKEDQGLNEYAILSRLDELVKICWDQKPGKRPDMGQVHEKLSEIFLIVLSAQVAAYEEFSGKSCTYDEIESPKIYNSTSGDSSGKL